MGNQIGAMCDRDELHMVVTMAHDPDNDLCASPPFESCTCDRSVAEQIELRNRAELFSRVTPARLTSTGYQGEVDDELEVLDD